MLQKESLENQSELLMKDKELSTLKEENKLLTKQFFQVGSGSSYVHIYIECY